MDIESWIQIVLSVCTLVTISDGEVASMFPLKPLYPLDFDEMDCPHPDDVIADIYYSSQQIPLGMPDRALRTLPDKWFAVAPSTIPGANLGVFTTTFIRANTWLAEYEGPVVTLEEAGECDDFDCSYIWEITKEGTLMHYVDGQDETVSSWIRYINAPIHITKINVEPSMCFGKVFYRISLDVPPWTELFVDYGPYDMENLGYDLDQYYDKDYQVMDKNKD